MIWKVFSNLTDSVTIPLQQRLLGCYNGDFTALSFLRSPSSSKCDSYSTRDTNHVVLLVLLRVQSAVKAISVVAFLRTFWRLWPTRHARSTCRHWRKGSTLPCAALSKPGETSSRNCRTASGPSMPLSTRSTRNILSTEGLSSGSDNAWSPGSAPRKPDRDTDKIHITLCSCSWRSCRLWKSININE